MVQHISQWRMEQWPPGIAKALTREHSSLNASSGEAANPLHLAHRPLPAAIDQYALNINSPFPNSSISNNE